MFNKKYGLELMAQIPVTPPTKMTSYWYDGIENSQAKANEIRLKNYLIYLSFIMEL